MIIEEKCFSRHILSTDQISLLIPFTSWDIWKYCVVIICCSVYDTINFEINLSLLNKPFFYITKNSKQKCKYFKNRKCFQHETKNICYHFNGFSVVRNCLRPDSGLLNWKQKETNHNIVRQMSGKCISWNQLSIFFS